MIMPAKQCTATSKRTGERCKANAMNGRDVCYHHGGRSLRGADHPNWKGGKTTAKIGRYSADLPERLVDAYERSVTDPQLIHLSSEIGVLDARIAELIGKIDAGDPNGRLEEIDMAWAGFAEKRKAGDVEGMNHSLQVLEAAITRERTDGAIWEQIQKAIDLRRKLANTQRMILTDEQNVVTASQVITLAQTLVSIIRERVKDPMVVQLIKQDFAALISIDRGPNHDALAG